MAPGVDVQEATLKHYDRRLHCALRNRQAELDYLRCTVTRLFPYVLPLHSLKCRSLCVLVREIVSGAILLPLADKLADPVSVIYEYY